MTDRVTNGLAPAPPATTAGGAGGPAVATRSRKRFSVLTRRDKIVLTIMVGIPTFLHVFFIWVPTVVSGILSFTTWNGIGGLENIDFVGLQNYRDLFGGIYPPFWPALQHNIIWLVVFMVLATPAGIFMAVLLDKEMRGSRIYQSALYLPVVLSLAIVGFIWQLIYSPDQGFINSVLGTAGTPEAVDWLGNNQINLFMILIAASWRHVGYIMVLYLAGLKSVDPSLREAAAIDGASERQTFFRVVFPVLRPINIVVIVITVIESLRAFDLVFITNRGLNGLELLSVLVTNNIIGEASRIGFGSAIAMILLVISVGPIIFYLTRSLRAEQA